MTELGTTPAGDWYSSSPAGGSFRRPVGGRLADRAYVVGIGVAALVGVVITFYLVVEMLGRATPTWEEIGFWEFVTGTEWAPALGQFGALPAIYGTLLTSAIAMAIAVPLAIGVAIGTTVMLPRRLRGPIAGLIDLLAAIPSVVYGLWGFIVLVPAVRPVFQWIADHNAGLGAFEGPVLGQSLLLASLVLAVMILPIITAVVREVLATTPVDQCEAALALGATRWEMIRGAMLPWARSGIVGASALGLGRALGETIAVAMVLGSQPTLLGSLLGSGQTIAGTIAFQYNSADSALHSSSLIAMAILLLVVSLLVSLLSRVLVARTGSRGAGRVRGASEVLAQRLRSQVARAWSLVRPRRPPLPGSPWIPSPPRRLPSVGRLRRVRSRCVEVMIVLCVAIAMVPLVLVIGYCVVKGAGALSVDFFSSDGEPDLAGNGIKHALVGTLILIGIATAVAVPLGVLTALFLREAATQGAFLRRTAGAIGGFIDVMLGVPSVVAGLTVAIAVVVTFGFSAIAGGLALALIMYPIVVRAADEILRLVPEAQVDAAMALGAPRWRAAWTVVLPAAAPGILTGVMIAVARVSGETAPLLVTSDSSQFFSTDITSSIAALPVYIFNGTINSTVPVAQQHAWGAALVLVAIVLFFNLSARLVSWLASYPRSA